MSRDKQIEEMAILFAKEYCNPKGCDCCNLIDEYCDRELSCEDYLGYKRMAETFYEQGYRKASEFAREIIADLVKFADDKETQRLINGHSVWYIESDDITDFIAELKKKYTESEKDNG